MSQREQARLPANWCWATIAELGTVVTGSTPSKNESKYFGGSVPFVKPTDLNAGYYVHIAADSLTEAGAAESRLLPPMSVLVTCIGATIGKTGLARVKCATNQQINAVMPRTVAVMPEWLYWTISSMWGQKQIIENSSATTLPIINKSRFVVLIVPLAPLPEQRRIVAKIEELFSDLDAGVAALERVRANLKRYRAAVLKAAVEGRLTEQWRAAHPPAEPAGQLLARILTERRKKWEETQLRKSTAAGKTPPKGWREKYEEPVGPAFPRPQELPKSWSWTSVAQVASGDDYALAIGPFGSNLKVSDYTSSGVPLVFVRNIRTGRFGAEWTQHVSAAKAAELRAHTVAPGDILVTKMGDPPGDACIYPVGQPMAVITADCIKLQAHPALRNPRFFVNAINSVLVKEQIARITKGVAQQKVSLARFSGIGLSLPPLDEQAQIVAEVERRLSVVGAVEAEIAHSLQRAGRLRQAILKRAFEGKLVPQDPADEPAEELLERIRAQARAAPPSAARRRRTAKELAHR